MIIADRNGKQPVHLAATRNHRAIIDFLYDCGIDLQAVDENCRQAIHLAALHGGTTFQHYFD
jgi:ankyrin repeat protein